MSTDSIKVLREVELSPEFYDRIEKEIRVALLSELYVPLLTDLEVDKKSFQNSISSDLETALLKSRIVYYRGKFTGKFNARTSLALKKLGATFDRKIGTYNLTLDKMPMNLRQTISVSESRLSQKLMLIDQKLEKILPAEIADSIKLEKIIDASLFKMQKDIGATLKGISNLPNLTDESRTRIANEYTKNIRLSIADWTQGEVKKLRQAVQDSTFAGNRFESMASALQSSYGLSSGKAKFIARQESKLLMAKFKETRYAEAGVYEYKWICVNASPNHPVRPMHAKLGEESKKGKIFRFDDPPIVNEKGDHKNPGEDFGCRCKARAVVRF